jgi:uncharacterized membrane-anchored protein
MEMQPPPDFMTTKLLNKVPQVTLFFWIIKTLATTVGETGADFLNVKLGFGLSGTSLVMGALLLAALVVQVVSSRYVPWKYWLAVVLLSVVGTLITDNLTDNLGVSLFVSTGVFSVALIATFVIWYAVEKTLSVHEISTRKRELFYWAAILFTFALGTASGDLMGEKLQLGYLLSTFVFAAMIAAVAFAHFALGLNGIAAFWLAYILTRPLGASMGDLLSQKLADGGLGLGTTATSAVFLAIIITLVAYLTLQRSRETEVPAIG